MSGIVGTTGVRAGTIGAPAGREHIATFDGYTNPQTNPAGSTTDGVFNKIYRPEYEHYIIDIANLGISGNSQQILLKYFNLILSNDDS